MDYAAFIHEVNSKISEAISPGHDRNLANVNCLKRRELDILL